jgi:hypothetical protein
MVGAARRVLDGELPDALVDGQRARFELLFETLRSGIAGLEA